MNDIGLFNKLFGKHLTTKKVYTSLSLTDALTSSFTTFDSDIYEAAVARSCIHAIASNAAKLKPVHIRRTQEGIQIPNNKNVQHVIAVKPNELMSAYDFYYKLITQLYNKNNAFAMIDRNSIGLVRLLPINYSTVEAVEYQNEIFLRFILNNGKILTLPYNDIIHLRRFFYDKEMFGEDNKALNPTLEVIETTNEGLSEGTKSAATLRGILKFSGMLKDSDMQTQRDNFVSEYLDVSNNGGVAATDSKMEYVPLESKPVLVDSNQMKAIRDQLYMYFNINENVVMNNYTEDVWNAFYESVLEPLAIQLSQEYTNKIFTKNAMTMGNEIIFEANRLAYASNTTKISFVKEVGVLGAIKLNEVREIFNMSPLSDEEGGNKRVQTLNVVNAANADAYQNGGESNVEE